jgi:pimeloyl-ACP methyl ester carboxylesterase
MKKLTRTLVIALVVIVGFYFAWKYVRDEHYPIPIQPSESWEPYLSSLDAQRESVFVEANDGTILEADLFIPNGGQEQKPAVVFTPGSSDSLYQNYSPGLIETFILDLFLSRDFAVLLVNKRGMGQSEGNYVKNSIEGRADDLYASVHFIQNHPSVDPENIGVIGHSQGGWVVAQAAGDHPDIAFFISLAGPTVTMRENSIDNQTHYAECQGMEGKDLDEYLAKSQKMIDISVSIGNLTNFGFFGFDARNMDFDPSDALLKVKSPGLYILAENDVLVTPALNIARMEEIFDGDIPAHFNTVVIGNATHGFRIVNDPCEILDEQPLSDELVEVLNTWLTEIGY